MQKVDENTFDLFEVKATGSAKPEHNDDLAFQTVVLERAGLSIRNISVIHADGTYVRDGEIDPKALTAITDITEKVRAKIDITEAQIDKAVTTASLEEMPDPSPRYTGSGAQKEWLKIYQILNGKLPPYNIYTLPKVTSKKITLLEDAGIQTVLEIPEDFELTPTQERYAQALQSDRVSQRRCN